MINETQRKLADRGADTAVFEISGDGLSVAGRAICPQRGPELGVLPARTAGLPEQDAADGGHRPGDPGRGPGAEDDGHRSDAAGAGGTGCSIEQALTRRDLAGAFNRQVVLTGGRIREFVELAAVDSVLIGRALHASRITGIPVTWWRDARLMGEFLGQGFGRFWYAEYVP